MAIKHVERLLQDRNKCIAKLEKALKSIVKGGGLAWNGATCADIAREALESGDNGMSEKLSEHEHERTLQANYSTWKGFEFLFYCQQCYQNKDKEHLSLDDIQYQLNKIAQLETCDLCDEPAEYRQCQKCMNDKLVGSHTDEEWDKLKSEIDQLKENIKKLVQLKLMTETERRYYYKELANLVY